VRIIALDLFDDGGVRLADDLGTRDARVVHSGGSRTSR
jgi:hypothetical protein